MSVVSPHVFVSGSTQLDLRRVVAVADTSDASIVIVYTVTGQQEGVRVLRGLFTAAYQASLNAS